MNSLLFAYSQDYLSIILISSKFCAMSNALFVDITNIVSCNSSRNIRKRKAMSDETKAKIAQSQSERHSKRMAASIDNQAQRTTIKASNYVRNYYIREDGVKMKDNLTYSRYECLIKSY